MQGQEKNRARNIYVCGRPTLDEAIINFGSMA